MKIFKIFTKLAQTKKLKIENTLTIADGQKEFENLSKIAQINKTSIDMARRQSNLRSIEDCPADAYARHKNNVQLALKKVLKNFKFKF